jgi:hypothetical protein
MIVRIVAECFRVLPHLFDVNFRSDLPVEADGCTCSSFQNSAGSYMTGRAHVGIADDKMRNALRALFGWRNVHETHRDLPRCKAAVDVPNGCTIAAAIADTLINRQFAYYCCFCAKYGYWHKRLHSR